MNYQENSRSSEIIENIVVEVTKKLSSAKSKHIVSFIKHFYSNVAYEDLAEHDINDLYGAALSMWRFMQTRKSEEAKIRVYNPSYEKHGWQSTHTIIEVLVDDMPFLVDSIRSELDRHDLTTHLIVSSGGAYVERDKNDKLTAFLGDQAPKGKEPSVEALIYFEVTRQTEPGVLEDITAGLKQVLADVRITVEDWQPMCERVADCIDELTKSKAPIDAEEKSEAIDFMKWLKDDNFTFLGCRDYDLVEEKGKKVLKAVPDTGLGLLRGDKDSHVSLRLDTMTPEGLALFLSPQILTITKTSKPSTVHRPVHLDYIGVKRINKDNEVIGERRILGLFTSVAYTLHTKQIPLLRRKVKMLMEQSTFISKDKRQLQSHASKVLANILETLPRDDLFQGTNKDLLNIALGIFHLQERRRIRLLARRDVFGNFVSCLVYVPRDIFNTDLRKRMQLILMKAFHGHEVTFSTRFSDSVLARIHFWVRTDPHDLVEADLDELEQKLIATGRTWNDDLNDALTDYFGEERGSQLFQRYENAFPAYYREDFNARTAVYDIKHIEQLKEEEDMGMHFFRPLNDVNGMLRFKIYQLKKSMPLSDVIPILENMGLRVINEHPYEVQLRDGTQALINDFGMVYCGGDAELNVDKVREAFQEAFANIWYQQAESDKLNQLVLGAGLNWREVSMLRAYSKYFRQAAFTFSQSYIAETVCNHPKITANLVKLFSLRFDPDAQNRSGAKLAQDVEKTLQTLTTQFDNVANLDEDRILRRYCDLIQATLRTNYYQYYHDKKSYLSFKLDSAKIPELPLPIPKFEIYVYSPRFEGIHLRTGKVARGGLRWSDRREDFRTEVLGLMKAQAVKNVVIVPSGAKGGFVPKHLPVDGTREEVMNEAICCYKQFISGLLDITDNMVDNKIVPPKFVVRYDDDDPYLVVAADKGTATFSDIANGIAEQYGFWLGDAFASGGSVGYDHKKMGITARGAWVSVKRHFRELGHNTQENPFTVLGIGDMAGDVFGNGMLLSKQIKLVIAFNHMHIFIDPDPDPETSFQERQRLFNLPRSTWADYNPKLISKGGGVFRRSAKSIQVTREIKQLLDLDQDFIVPNELLRAALKARVDLFWNGGIGTFVKATSESDLDVGDRTNDAIRIDAKELRAKVVGEGGNLGLTQLARVEYAYQGGLLYTDFVDNAGGVDCSDHEVNIKILLNKVVEDGDMTVKQRSALLEKMTDEVADDVLRNNYRQTQAISLAAMTASSNIELHRRYIQYLEEKGKIDRTLEFLPDEAALSERKLSGKGLFRPGIAILMAYTKMHLKYEILETDVPDDPYLTCFLEEPFPKPLREKYAKQMQDHSLRREIVATRLSNSIVNEMGFTFVHRLQDETGAPVSAIVRAYTIAREIYDLESTWREIESLDYKIPSSEQYNMMLQLIRLMRRSTRWILRNRRMHLDIESTLKAFKPGIEDFFHQIPHVLKGTDREHYKDMINRYVELGASKSLAQRIASTRPLLSALDLLESNTACGEPIENIANVYFSLGSILDLSWIRTQVIIFPVETHWESLSREALRDDLDWQQRQLTTAILTMKKSNQSIDEVLESWQEKYSPLIQRWGYILEELKTSSKLSFTMLFVAIRELLDLTQTSQQKSETRGGGPSKPRPTTTKESGAKKSGPSGKKPPRAA